MKGSKKRNIARYDKHYQPLFSLRPTFTFISVENQWTDDKALINITFPPLRRNRICPKHSSAKRIEFRTGLCMIQRAVIRVKYNVHWFIICKIFRYPLYCSDWPIQKPVNCHLLQLATLYHRCVNLSCLEHYQKQCVRDRLFVIHYLLCWTNPPFADIQL